MKKISRRSFLAAAGLSVAALALTACGCLLYTSDAAVVLPQAPLPPWQALLLLLKLLPPALPPVS